MTTWKNTLQTADEVVEVKRKAVFREAGRIFSRRGYHNTSLDDVAKALNVSKGTLYNYVKDKQEILYECHSMALDIAETAVDASMAIEDNPLQRLRTLMNVYITTLFDEFGVCGVITEIDALRPKDRKKIVARRDRYEEFTVGIIEEAIKANQVRALDSVYTAKIIMGSINSVSRWYTPKGRLDNIEIAQKTIDLFFEGMSI